MSASRFIKCVTVGDGAVGKTCLLISYTSNTFPTFSSSLLLLSLVSAVSLSLKAYADADWGNCIVTRRSTTGHCVFLGNSLISWRSKRQHTVSRSSAEAEYRSLATGSSEVTWISNLLSDFGITLDPVLVFCDNHAAIHIATNHTFHERTKHIDIDCHFVEEKGYCRVVKFGRCSLLISP